MHLMLQLQLLNRTMLLGTTKLRRRRLMLLSYLSINWWMRVPAVLAVSAGFDNGAAGDGYNTDAVVGRAAQRWLLM